MENFTRAAAAAEAGAGSAAKSSAVHTLILKQEKNLARPKNLTTQHVAP